MTNTTLAIKTATINLRARPEEKAILVRAAKVQGVSVSGFIMEDAITHAKKVLLEAEQLVLDDQDRQAFINAFLEPYEATPYMKNAIKSYNKG